MQAPIRDLIGGLPLPQSWVTWFQTVDNFIRSGSSSGTTANRPTKNLFVGLSYMDNDLRKQIQIQSLNPTVWVDSNGDDPDVAPVVVTAYPVSCFVYEFAIAVTPIADSSMEYNAVSMVSLSGHTQVRAVFSAFLSGGALPAGTYIYFGYVTTLSDAKSGVVPIEITSSSSKVLTSSFTAGVYYEYDTGWMELKSGLDGDIFPIIGTGGGDGAPNPYRMEYVTFLFK